MCQVGEDYGEAAPLRPRPPRPGVQSQQLKCVKCKEGDPVVVIRAGDAFCRDCFKAFYVHKFRAVLGKNRLIFPGEKVLLAWSGGPSSSSMLWQVLEGLSRNSAKQLRFVPGVVYVDEGATCGRSLEERARTLAEVQATLLPTGLPWHGVTLEEVFGLPPSVLRHFSQEPTVGDGAYKEAVDGFIRQQQGLGNQGARASPHPASDEGQPSTQDPQGLVGLPSAAQTEALVRLFASVKTLTAKEELLQTLRTHLLLHIARTHGYSKLMMGDSCTRLAIKLLTNLALGRGAFLAWDTGFADERHGDVVVVRPMREHTLKEVVFYNRLFAVPTVLTPTVSTKAPENASVHRLIEAFVLQLQAQFPSTVSTVYRTGEKLVKAPRVSQAPGSSSPRCLLCLCTLDVDCADSATAFGAQTTLALSQRQPPSTQAEGPTAPCGPPVPGGDQGCCRGTGCSQREGSRACILEQLCYSCRVNMKDLPSLEPLPPYILSEAQLRSHRTQVTKEIQEFLIEDSDDELETGPS